MSSPRRSPALPSDAAPRRLCVLALYSALWLVSLAVPGGPAEAVSIRSWDDDNQRGEDLFNAQFGFGYEPFENALIARNHVILPGVSELTALDLALVDVFFWGTSDHVLSATEQTVLLDFVSGGGLLILETDDFAAEQAAANSAYSALGLGSIDPTLSGSTSADQGSFANVVSRTTLGPLGDLRGQTWSGSASPGVPAGGLGLGAVGGLDKWVEFEVGAGAVLGLADPYALSTFTRETNPFSNPNNLNAYLNFIESAPIPEPASGALVAFGLAGFAMWRRSRPKP